MFCYTRSFIYLRKLSLQKSKGQIYLCSYGFYIIFILMFISCYIRSYVEKNYISVLNTRSSALYVNFLYEALVQAVVQS